MKITSEWLQRHNTCLSYSAYSEWFKNQTETKPEALLEKLISEEKLDWANWLIVRVLTHKQGVAYAIYAAEQVLKIFEKHNSEDERPRKTIDAARAVLKRNTQKNREAASVAAYYAATATACTAYYAYAAAYYAAFAAAYGYAYSATAAERAANSAAKAAYASAYANTTYDAYCASVAAKKMKSRILAFGLKLLRKGN
jgi:hypothetical protein